MTTGTADKDLGVRAQARRATAVPISLLLTLYLLVTGRWGSYLGIPGAPFYIGDLLVAFAVVQVIVAARAGPALLGGLTRAPVIFLLALALVAYAGLRMVSGLQISVVTLRDFAPYGYAIVALPAYLLPVREGGRWRLVIYACFVAHLLWVVLLPRVAGFPWSLPVLGSDAILLVARPDFDSAVLGLGAAFAVRDLLLHVGARRPAETAGLAAFIAASLFGVVGLGTRAGLLAGLFAGIAVVVTATMARSTWARPNRPARVLRVRLLRLAAGVIFLSIAVGAAALTPSGSRLVAGVSDASSSAYGTVAVRKNVWDRVGDYVLRDPQRTAIGVGFGRNFIAESGSSLALEGTEYQNVRSPHNYVIGTLARLGVAGALLVSIIIGLGWWLALSRLRQPASPVTTLASLLALTLPVIALLGVVLESPFGAIPFFWALGHLAAAGTRKPAL